jgi:hypothetical protein
MTYTSTPGWHSNNVHLALQISHFLAQGVKITFVRMSKICATRQDELKT